MTAFLLHAADVLQAARRSGRGFVARKLSLPWFLLLLVGSLWLLLRTAEIAAAGDVPSGLTITPGSLLFAAFLLSLGKGAVDASYRMVRQPTLVYALALPLPRRRIVAAKLATVLALNLGFLALALGVATGMILALRMDVPAGGPFVPGLVAAVFGGLCAGFALAVAASLATWRRKGAGLALLATLPAAAWVALVQEDLAPAEALPVLTALAGLALLASLLTDRFLVEAWTVQAAARGGADRVARELRLPGMTAAEAAVFEKEVKTSWRRRELALGAATLAFVAIALAAVYVLLGGPPSGRFARVLLPTLAMAGVWAAAAVTLTVRGLSAIGGEHESLWILRTAPVRGRDVAAGKAAAHLLLLPGVVFVALPLAALAGFPWDTAALVTASAATAGLVMASVGVSFGSRAPNFDRDTGGLPDAFTLYGVFIAGLIACVVAIGPAAALFPRDRLAGVAAGVLTAELAFLLWRFAVGRAGPRIDRLEA